MKHTRKRILSIFAAAALAFYALPQDTSLLLHPALVARAADTGTCGENLTWILDNNVLTISGTGDMKDYPDRTADPPEDRTQGPPWFYQFPWNSSSRDIKKVVIEDGVTSIGKEAFAECTTLTSITIPDSVTSIGVCAFADCTALTDITLPESLTSISDSAFSQCTKLTGITIPDGVTSIGSNAFANCDALTEITIPDSVTSIGYSAFVSCEALESITIPESVTSFGTDAFAGTPWLKAQQEENPLVIVNGILLDGATASGNILIPYGVTSIGHAAFCGCDLTDVTVPDSVTSIGASAFTDCTALKSITIPKSVHEISIDAFLSCNNLTIRGYAESYAEAYAMQNDIPFEQMEPEYKVYEGMKYEINGKEVVITGYTDDIPAVLNIPAEIDGKPVTDIAQMAFYSCDKLKEVTLPDSIVSFGFQNFLNCKNLEKVTLPKTLKAIHEAAFANCPALKSITIPEGCETIGNLVFSGCTALSEVEIPATVTEFGEPAFGETAWLNAKRAENPLVIVNGILLDGATASGKVVIPDGVKTIASYAFSWSDNAAVTKLTSVTIPGSVTVIGQCAFNGCAKLAKVNLPETAIRIGRAAFDDTPWMEERQAENPVVVACKSVINGKKATGKVTVPDGVQYISMGAFENNEALTEITLPASVSLIDRFGFEDCESLKRIAILNPDCEISDMYESGDTICNGTDTKTWEKYYNGKIAGYKASTAQAYAAKYGYAFESLGEAPQTTPPATTTAVTTTATTKQKTSVTTTVTTTVTTSASQETQPAEEDIRFRFSLVPPTKTEYYVGETVDYSGSRYGINASLKTQDSSMGHIIGSLADWTEDIHTEEQSLRVGDNYQYDVTFMITVDKSKVNTAKAGVYPVTLTSTNAEGTYVYAQVSFDITIKEKPAETSLSTTAATKPTTTVTTTATPKPVTTIFTTTLPITTTVIQTTMPDYAPRVTWDDAPMHVGETRRIHVEDPHYNTTVSHASIYCTADVFTWKFDAEKSDLIITAVEPCERQSFTVSATNCAFTMQLFLTILPADTTAATIATTTKPKTTVTTTATTKPKTTGTTTATTKPVTTVFTTTLPITTTVIQTTMPDYAPRVTWDDSPMHVGETRRIHVEDPYYNTTVSHASIYCIADVFTWKFDAEKSDLIITAVEPCERQSFTVNAENCAFTMQLFLTILPAETTDVLTGDINDDGAVSVEDAQLTLIEYVSTMAGKAGSFSEKQKLAGDINGDNAVSVEDAQMILLYYVKNTLSGTSVTWDELRSPKTQPLPRLTGKRRLT